MTSEKGRAHAGTFSKARFAVITGRGDRAFGPPRRSSCGCEHGAKGDRPPISTLPTPRKSVRASPGRGRGRRRRSTATSPIRPSVDAAVAAGGRELSAGPRHHLQTKRPASPSGPVPGKGMRSLIDLRSRRDEAGRGRPTINGVVLWLPGGDPPVSPGKAAEGGRRGRLPIVNQPRRSAGHDRLWRACFYGTTKGRGWVNLTRSPRDRGRRQRASRVNYSVWPGRHAHPFTRGMDPEQRASGAHP